MARAADRLGDAARVGARRICEAASLDDGAVFDLPPQPVQRYIERQTPARHALWRFNQKCRAAPAGLILRLELPEPAIVHWGSGG